MYPPPRSSFKGPDVALMPSAPVFVPVADAAAVVPVGTDPAPAAAAGGAAGADGLRSIFLDSATFAGVEIWGVVDVAAVAVVFSRVKARVTSRSY